MREPYYTPMLRMIVQGATGTEGRRAVEFMKSYGTNVVAGVTPGKGGQEVSGVPIFNSIAEVISEIGTIDGTSLYVPPAANKAAVTEAVNNGITFVHILTEGTPRKDLAYLVTLCKQKGVLLLGPGSLGIIVTDINRIGMIGGPNPKETYTKGTISVISRSGGMANEIVHFLAQHEHGVRAVVHLGAEKSTGVSLTEQLTTFLNDSETETIVIFEEIMHHDLTALYNFAQHQSVSKPIFLIVAGTSFTRVPADRPFGHFENLLNNSSNHFFKSFEDLHQLFQKRGITVLNHYDALRQQFQ